MCFFFNGVQQTAPTGSVLLSEKQKQERRKIGQPDSNSDVPGQLGQQRPGDRNPVLQMGDLHHIPAGQVRQIDLKRHKEQIDQGCNGRGYGDFPLCCCDRHGR